MLDEARWLAGQGVRELFLVSENSTSYGKDLGDLRLLETLLPELAAVDGVDRVRVSYLQPAETRPGLVEAIATTPGVAPYFDLSFQHASGAGAAPDAPLRRRRELPRPARPGPRAWPREAGVRSNVIVGFPGETEADLEVLSDFLVAARHGRHRGLRLLRRGRHRGGAASTTSSTTTRSRARVAHVTGAGRGAHRPAGRGADRRARRGAGGVASTTARPVEGRAAHQGPEVDGTTTLLDAAGRRASATWSPPPWSASEGVDLVARAGAEDRR